MDQKLSAGEFEALTGLTPKALRLYAERGILSPAEVDPVNAYRSYDRSQLRHGISLDLLRRAQVPLVGLAEAEDFDFDARRQTVAFERVIEDFYLDLAERIASFDPADFVAHLEDAPAVEWIGVVVDLGIPDDLDGRVEAFAGLAQQVPAIDRAFVEGLAAVSEQPSDIVWTAVPEATRAGAGRILIARPTVQSLDRRAQDAMRAHLASAAIPPVTVVTGNLPSRVEITFTGADPAGTDPIDDAALGHLHLLAFEHHRRLHGLAALDSTPRQVVRGASLADAAAPVSVFDVHPSAGR